MSEWLQMNLQNPNNNFMLELHFFHEWVMFLMSFILMKIIFFLFFINKFNRGFAITNTDNSVLEFVWTIFPFVLLMLMLTPSLLILYMFESLGDYIVSLKITGYQWYWSYDLNQFYFNSDNFLNKNCTFRLLETTNSLILPYMTNIMVYITSMDVLHSWSVPSLAVKMDAIPGRLNEFMLYSVKSGRFFGQCSEICGINHSFMPIDIMFVKMDLFLHWVLMEN